MVSVNHITGCVDASHPAAFALEADLGRLRKDSSSFSSGGSTRSAPARRSGVSSLIPLLLGMPSILLISVIDFSGS